MAIAKFLLEIAGSWGPPPKSLVPSMTLLRLPVTTQDRHICDACLTFVNYVTSCIHKFTHNQFVHDISIVVVEVKCMQIMFFSFQLLRALTENQHAQMLTVCVRVCVCVCVSMCVRALVCLSVCVCKATSAWSRNFRRHSRGSC